MLTAIVVAAVSVALAIAGMVFGLDQRRRAQAQEREGELLRAVDRDRRRVHEEEDLIRDDNPLLLDRALAARVRAEQARQRAGYTGHAGMAASRANGTTDPTGRD